MKTCLELVKSDVARGATNTPRPLTHPSDQAEGGLAMDATQHDPTDNTRAVIVGALSGGRVLVQSHPGRGYELTNEGAEAIADLLLSLPQLVVNEFRKATVSRVEMGCIEPGCDRPHGARGYCEAHYQRLRRRGQMPKLPPVTDDERFWARVDKVEDGCWNWTGTLFAESGYGQFSYMIGKKSKTIGAHKYLFELLNGKTPRGMHVDHRCRNRRCVRPDHLRLATPKQNGENLGGANSASKSGVRGVYYDNRPERRRAPYRAVCQHNKKTIHIGFFQTLEEAGEAARLRRNELFTHNDADRTA